MRYMLMLLAAVLAGCHVPAQIHFSPDGRRAIYGGGISQTVLLIDANGNVLRSLGQGHGAAAFSADGRRVYYAVRAEADAEMVTIDPLLWQSPGRGLELTPVHEPGGLDLPDPPEDAQTVYVIENDGEPKPLFSLPGMIWRMVVSPDGKWLLVHYVGPAYIGQDRGDAGITAVYSIEQNRLLPLTAGEGVQVAGCFTADNQVVYLRPIDPSATVGTLVRRSLSTDERTRIEELGGVAVTAMSFVASLPDGDLLLSAMRLTLPASQKDLEASRVGLQRLNPGTGAMELLVDDIIPYFDVSADGSHVLLAGGEKRPGGATLELLDLKTGKPRTLLPLAEYGSLPMFPRLVGSDGLVFVAAPAMKKSVERGGQRFSAYDIVRYTLTGSEIKPTATLSAKWDATDLPGVREQSQAAEARE